MIGIAKAAVLPVPVCALASISLPSSKTGMACAWIGEGVKYPSCSTASKIGLIMFNCSNVICSPCDLNLLLKKQKKALFKIS